MIRALLIDLDGVLRIWPDDHGAHIERDHGLPLGTIAAAAFAPELLEPALTGVVSDEAWRGQVARKLAEQHGPRTAGAVEAWSAFRGIVDQTVVNLIGDVRDLMPVVLLTNQTSRLRSDLDMLGLADAFDAIANSADIGVAKPAHEAFEAASRLARVGLTECAFIDDGVGNVDMARQLGMTAIQHVSAADDRRALVACGVALTPRAKLI